MRRFLRNLTLCFSAGALGGLINSLAIWFAGRTGLTALFGVTLAPAFTQAWVYPRIVWGGIWGVLFLLPLFRKLCFLRGLIYSIAPTLVQLFIVFPVQAKKGIMGLELGMLTPLFVIIFNAVWGISAALWLKVTQDTEFP
jgi:hypothetical protein